MLEQLGQGSNPGRGQERSEQPDQSSQSGQSDQPLNGSQQGITRVESGSHLDGKKRARKRRNRKRSSKSDASKLSVYFANITQFGSEANRKRAFLCSRQEDVVGVVETHLDSSNSSREYGEISKAGWTAAYSPAKPSEEGDGCKGGALLMHKPWLQSAIPVEATGCSGQVFPEGDLVWKHFRLQGIHFVLAFIYMEHTIGMTGPNLCKMRKLHELTDGGRRKLVAVGDWNMHPELLMQSGLLDTMGLRVVTAGNDNTCKTSSGSSLLDYIVCDSDVAHLIDDVMLEVVWMDKYLSPSSPPRPAGRLAGGWRTVSGQPR